MRMRTQARKRARGIYMELEFLRFVQTGNLRLQRFAGTEIATSIIAQRESRKEIRKNKKKAKYRQITTICKQKSENQRQKVKTPKNREIRQKNGEDAPRSSNKGK